jgi:hypothetical protein
MYYDSFRRDKYGRNTGGDFSKDISEIFRNRITINEIN